MTGPTRTSRAVLAALLLTVLGALTALPAPAAPPGSAPPRLRVLVTNDDGYDSPGIDALVEALRKLRRVTVTVVAPATNQSGTGDRTSPTPPTATDVETASGYPATAVAGTPADSVLYALDELGRRQPDLVISGVNQGQNLGPVVDVSGTVGAARTAAREGVPALAVSAGLADAPDYATGARQAVRWVKRHRAQLARGDVTTTDIVNLNIPTCSVGEIRGVIEVPAATTGDALAPSDCTSTLTDPADDVVAFTNGYATRSEIPAG